MMPCVSLLDDREHTLYIVHLLVFPQTFAIRPVLQVLDVSRVITVICRELKRVRIKRVGVTFHITLFERPR